MGDTADGDAVFFGEFLFIRAGAAPGGEEPAGVFLFPVGFEAFEVLGGGDILVSEGEGFL